ncbi:LPXTG cell wall anchor domain-containing protein [uncultured Demequina sp.]|uniref:LPXTG cell wall anchor domain-containing protein n=1 Tax=uncultured Demequina sp. TaxID=693499 RepID=UPI0025CDB2CB|nr:LPXTG cell wall anchor domain-containing protein [uncultured Demequina sp.]
MSPVATKASASLTKIISTAIAVPVLTVATLSLSAIGAAAPASAAGEHLVTLVARVCPTYADITANKARNDIMESLRDLGPDTPYARSGQVDAQTEISGSPNCQPLSDWGFTLGEGYTGKTAATLQLSTVTGAYPGLITTEDSTPWLDSHGNPTGDTIEGATTIALTPEQVSRATNGGRNLWIQGGSPSAPLNGKRDELGYGALRCAVDALNGDNVEYIAFPRNAEHVFCFYYAVQPPPTAGEIVVHKEVTPGATDTSHAVFTGTVPYGDTDGNGVNDFTLDASAGRSGSETFIRGAVSATDPAWTITESDDPDWMLVDGHPTCTSRDGTSRLTYTDNGVSIELAGLDRVECTFTNAPVPQAQPVVEPPLAQPTPTVTPTPMTQSTPDPLVVPHATPQLTPHQVPTATPQATPQATPTTIPVPQATPQIAQRTPMQVPTATPQATPQATPTPITVPTLVTSSHVVSHTPSATVTGRTPSALHHVERVPRPTLTPSTDTPTTTVAGHDHLSHTGTDDSTLWIASAAFALLLSGGALLALRRRSRG